MKINKEKLLCLIEALTLGISVKIMDQTYKLENGEICWSDMRRGAIFKDIRFEYLINISNNMDDEEYETTHAFIGLVKSVSDINGKRKIRT